MPRNVRNFWLEASIDGRDTDLAGGPQSKDGGFEAKVLIRADGDIAHAVTISGSAAPDGSLELRVSPGNDARVSLDFAAGTTMILRSKR